MIKKGICSECNKPLRNPKALGYHSMCAIKLYARLDKEKDENFPFVILDTEGVEINRYKKLEDAEDFLFSIHNAIIEDRS